MPVIDEKAMNGFIAEAMESQAPPKWEVGPEQHGQARLGTTTPDIVVRMPYSLRTIIETEYGDPAIADAKTRLGYEFKDYTLPMKSVIALGIPRELGEMSHADRRVALASDEPQFLMQVVTGASEDDPNINITPAKPVSASLRDVVQYAWLVAIPELYTKQLVHNVVRKLQAAKEQLTHALQKTAGRTQARLLREYGNHTSQQGLESAAGNVVGTLASMFQLHMNLKQWGALEDLRDIGTQEFWQSITPRDGIPSRIAEEWRKIEEVDYKPLSTISAEMLEDSDLAPQLGGILRTLLETMADAIRPGISETTNISAEMWQALIPDRDERAAYYTKPATAELLANMTTARLVSPATARYNEICAGTGTLARATEENIRFRHYAATDEKTSIHAERMERYIQLTDINPQSTSVATASMTALEPGTPFESSAIFAITALGGSLNFLTKKGVSDMGQALIGRNGASAEALILDPGTVGICCNNDPYFRARGGAVNPIPVAELQKFRRRADRYQKGVANAQAGLATFMHVIEHELLAWESPHGKVLPLTAAHAKTWEGFRKNIENHYRDVVVISTASGSGVSMSADTGMQEMLLIATKQQAVPKNRPPEAGDKAVTCVNLTATFATKVEAKMFADAIRHALAEGKDFGEVVVGDVVGTYHNMSALGDGQPWSALGTSGDYTTLVAQAASGHAWNPKTGRLTSYALPMTTLSGVSSHGPTHHLLGCLPASRDPRGAFTMYPAKDATNRENPSLWSHESTVQDMMTCLPTHYGVSRGDSAEAERMLATAGHFHIARNLRMSSQTVALAFTEQASVGGRSWTTLYANVGIAEALALYFNSTYGLIVRSGYGQSTHTGRATIQIRAIDGHPVPDFAADTEAGETARRIAHENFDSLRQLKLKRIALSAIDENRAEIDRVVTHMLGIPWDQNTKAMIDSWRKLMCLQPAVNGNNKQTLKILAETGIER